MTNKNQLTTTTGTGVALKNANRSLKITNKLLGEVDDFEKYWHWWLSLDNRWRKLFLESGLKLYDLDVDWYNKNLMKGYIKQVLKLTELDIGFNHISDISPLRNLTYLSYLDLGNNTVSQQDINRLQHALPNCKIQSNDLERTENQIWWDNLLIEWKAYFIKVVLKTDLLDYETQWDSNNKTSIFKLIYSEIDLNDYSEVKHYIDEIIELVELDMSSIPFSINSALPLEKLVNLQKLDLSQNVIHDISSVENLVNLTELNLSHIYGNIWSGLDISCLTKLQKLKEVMLYETVIAQDIYEIQACLPNCSFHW